MPDDGPTQITGLLLQIRDGQAGSLAQLMPLVYSELHRIAERRVHEDERAIGPTSLVHEVYLKLSQSSGFDVATRGHFFAVAATAMRQIIVDRARAHLRQKRGGQQQQITLDENLAAAEGEADQAMALDDALRRLEAIEPRLRHVVECRFFAGLTEDETAEAVGVTCRTVRSDWVKARALLSGMM
jgi:RNA polymerase sigma factor (TIGR02999 family)